MQRMLFALSFGFAALLYLTVQASAQSSEPSMPAPNTVQCAPRGLVLAKLQGQFGEIRQSMGLAGSGAIIEVFASPTTGSWTITATFPSGVSCIVTSGEYFERLLEGLPPQGAPV